MWNQYYLAASLDEAVKLLAEHQSNARIVAGATDLILELEKGLRPGVEALIDISRVAGLDEIKLDDSGVIHLGPMVTHNQAAASKLLREKAYPLARASWEVGAPQIRNRATIAGNLVTASPANDTISPLMALDAWLVLKSVRGERKVMLRDFYTGVRKTVLQPDEIVADVAFIALADNQKGSFTKVALRKAQAISIVNISIVLTLTGDVVSNAAITLGAVAPTIIHAPEAEAFLVGKSLTDEVIAQAATLTMQASRPISDIRSSADYRREMVRVFSARALTALASGEEEVGMPAEPITLDGEAPLPTFEASQPPVSVIETNINGKDYTFTTGTEKTLLRLLREDAGLIGTKEGCAEGECGACTIFLDGAAVMGCMVPAPRAHKSHIVTVEGLANGEQLHPVQDAFLKDGAVQCGYCTPGFLMSSAKLLQENPQPTRNQIEEAITGNLCRCTGYYKIVMAVEDASKQSA